MSSVVAPLKREQHLVRWDVSDHALDRYIERVVRWLPRRQALIELSQMLVNAHYVKTLSSGMEYWRGPKPRRLMLYVERGEPMKLCTVRFTFDR